MKKAFEDSMTEYGINFFCRKNAWYSYYIPLLNYCKFLFLGLPIRWTSLSDIEKDKALLRLLDSIEMSQRSIRMQAAKSILYLVQGVFGECLTLDKQAELSRANVFLLYKYGVFYTFVQLLNMEIEYVVVCYYFMLNVEK